MKTTKTTKTVDGIVPCGVLCDKDPCCNMFRMSSDGQYCRIGYVSLMINKSECFSEMLVLVLVIVLGSVGGCVVC